MELNSMKRKKVEFEIIIDEIKKRNQSGGYIHKFYNAPTPYYNLKKDKETEPYEREYEKKLAKENSPTDNKISEEVLEYYFQINDNLKKNSDIKIVLPKVILLNAFYRTTINNIDLVAVSRYICSLNFDELILNNGKMPNFNLVKK